MSIHAYFNIWCEAQKGFRIYSQRKTASKKIMSLKDATEDQLKVRNDDVCSICYEGFESAKVTNCGKYVHPSLFLILLACNEQNLTCHTCRCDVLSLILKYQSHVYYNRPSFPRCVSSQVVIRTEHLPNGKLPSDLIDYPFRSCLKIVMKNVNPENN